MKFLAAAALVSSASAFAPLVRPPLNWSREMGEVFLDSLVKTMKTT
jgi:hypothetical protein